MTIKITCGSCRQKYSVSEKMAGKSATCKQCGATLEIPLASGDELAPLTAEEPVVLLEAAEPVTLLDEAEPAAMLNPLTAMAPAQSSEGQGISPRILIAGGVGAVVLAVVVAILLVSGGSKDNEDAGSRGSLAEGKNPSAPAPSVPGGSTRPKPPASRPSPTRPSVRPKPGVPTEPSSPPGGPVAPEEPQASLVPWTAKSDPPATPFEFVGGTSFSVEMPRSVKVATPPQPSPFVMVVSDQHKAEGFKVFDMRTGEEKHSVARKLELREPLLLALDGLHAAGKADIFGKTISVLSLESGQIVGEYSRSDEKRIDSIQFAGPRHLLLGHEKSGAADLVVWDFSANKEIQRILVPSEDYDNRFDKESLVTSFSGRYAAMMMGRTLHVYDLPSGQCIGQSAIPKAVLGSISRCEGLTFSPDGSKLAGLFHHNSGLLVVCWDFATGKILHDAVCDRDSLGAAPGVHSYQGPKLAWLPDQSGWIIKGHILFDAKSGKSVWTFSEASRYPRIFLDSARLLTVRAAAGLGNSKMLIRPLPTDEMAKAAELVRSGGVAADAGLPPLTECDLSGARSVAQPSGPVAWSVQPDPAPVAANLPEKQTELGDECRAIRALRFSRDGTKLAVMKELSSPSGASSSAKAPLVLEAFVLPRCKQSKQIAMPARYDLMDISSDGRLALMGIRPDRSPVHTRLDVYDLLSGDHLLGWRPYGTQPESRDQEATWAAFVDSAHVLTINTSGRLVLWKLPECRAVYTMEGLRGRPCLSPGGKYLAAYHAADKTYRLYEAADGTCRGALETPSSTNDPRAIAFRRDGTAVALVIYGLIAGWDLADGELQWEAGIPTLHAADLGWRQEKYLLIENRYLFDIEKQVIVWKYSLSGGCHAAESPDPNHWYCAKEGSGPFNLVAMQTPSQHVKDQTAGANLAERAIIYPGAKVSLSVSVPGGHSRKFTESLTAKLQANGAIVAPGAPTRLSLTAQERGTGNMLKLESFGAFRGDRGSETFEEREIACTLTATRGSMIWKQERKIGMRTYGTVGSDTTSQTLYSQMRQGLGSYADSIAIPRVVFPNQGGEDYGTSRMTYGGEAPPLPKSNPSTRPGQGVPRVPTRPIPGRPFPPGGMFPRPGGIPHRP